MKWSLLLSFVLLAVVGCDAKPDPQLTVFAASSLSPILPRLARDFEEKNGSPEIRLQFAGTGQLVTQIVHGARADVLIAADPSYLGPLHAADLVKESRLLGQNRLAVIVHPRAATSVTSLAELPRAKRLVLGAEQVPVGKYARTFLRRAQRIYGADYEKRVLDQVVSHELNVRQVLSKVMSGEADAAIVYVTDARSVSGDVVILDIPDNLNITADYPVVVLDGDHLDLARRFADFLLSVPAQTHISDAGFSSSMDHTP